MKKPKAAFRSDGRWEAKGLDPVRGGRKSWYGKTAEEASTLAGRSFESANFETLEQYYDSVFVPTLRHHSDNWVEQVAWSMDHFVLPMFGGWAIEDIKRKDVQQAFNRWSRHVTYRGSTIKGSSLERIRRVWAAVMNLAVADEIIARNPLAQNIRLPKDPKPEHTVLTPGQLWTLVTGCSDLLRPDVLLQGFAGLRVGEACAETWPHIKNDALKGDILRVRQQVIQPKGGAKIVPKLKTPQSRRDIPLPAELVQMLRDCNQTSGIFVSSNDSGGFLTPSGVWTLLNKEAKALGLPHIGTHDLRHTFTSLLENEFEAPRRVVDAILGRAESGTTDDYSHTTWQQLTRWTDKYWDRVSTSLTTEKCRQGGLKLG